MGNNATDIWAWTYKDIRRLNEEGGLKKTIVENYNRFWLYFNNDHAAAEISINTALDAARAAGELAWELHLRHWRLQLWLRQLDLKRMLPEAIDLLALATDERVRHIPQRICAYHDIVECYVELDAGGYYNEIAENSRHILAQLPQRHPCATCARMHITQAAAAAGRVEEAEHWKALCEANLHESKYPEIDESFAEAYEELDKWNEAERYYLEARKLAQQRRSSTAHLKATLGVARARIAKGDIHGGVEMLHIARENTKHQHETAQLARLLEVEEYLANAINEAPSALDYLTRAARHYLELDCYRKAALTSLDACELANAGNLPGTEETLSIAARAVGALPPTSTPFYNRLAALGREPIAPSLLPSLDHQGNTDHDRQERDRKGLRALQDLLQAHLANNNAHGAAVTLYQIGSWHGEHQEHRAAVDYLIWNAVLERLLKFPMDQRRSTLGILGNLRQRLPAGTVEAALQAAESGPPDWLAPLLGTLPHARWRWLIQAVATESVGQPFVEPEPANNENANGFDEWLSYTASMVTLIVRFRDQADQIRCETWASSLDEVVTDIQQQIEQNGAANQGQEVISLVRGMASLSRGTSLEETTSSVLPPFNQVIEQIGQIARLPIWQHPEASPIDFLVEQAAQNAVRALTTNDKNRHRRLANLAFRYSLMTLDLRKQKALLSIARFLDALGELVLSEGQRLPVMEPALEAPFDSILTAVYEAGRVKNDDGH